jgi:asparagine synthase (glutamine-hydrolysing)
MQGVCGVVGSPDHAVDRMTDDLRWTGEEEVATAVDGDVAIGGAWHADPDRGQPASVGDVDVWVTGSVWGYRGDAGYRSYRDAAASTFAGFCARRYAEDGPAFAAGLNGTFAAVVHDRAAGVVHLVTDRLGTHPLYYARPDDEGLVFSTQVQSVARHPLVETGFDPDYLTEYFALGAVGGVRTPFTGVAELQPSSVTTVDLASGAVETERYWRPEYEPVEESYESFADRFVDAFTAALDERLDPDRTYGLLLSGGSDSRAILAGLDDDLDVRTYHATGWLSREARVAERVAFADDRPFSLLRRGENEHERMLETTPRSMNFQGRFNEAHVSEFAERLREEVDVLISGHGADTLFRDHAFPRPMVDLGPLGRFSLPVTRETASVEEFVTRRGGETPSYLDTDRSLAEVLRREIHDDDDGVSHHGVPYRSVEELVFFDDFYPFSNKADFFYPALNGMLPHWSPFFDDRLLDLALSLPMGYRTRHNLVDDATVALDPELGDIPHADSGAPLSRSFPSDYLTGLVNGFWWQHLSPDQPPKAHLNHGPWTDKRELIRSQGFVGERLRARSDLVDALPFLDLEGVYRCYDDHLNGADNTVELYTLLTFLHMPIVEELVGEESRSARPATPD